MSSQPFVDPQMQAPPHGALPHGAPQQPSYEYGPGFSAGYGQGAGPPPQGMPQYGEHMGGPPQFWQPSAPPPSGSQYAGYGGGAMSGAGGGIDGFDDAAELRKYERDHRPPKHSQASWAIMIMASISLLLTLMSLLTQEWRSNSVGVVGYSTKRSWGIFSVVGQRTQSHYEIQEFTCRAFGGLSVYIQLMWVSYTAGVFLIIGILVHLACMYWTYCLTPRLIRWAGTWWFMDIFFQVGAIAFWSVMTEDLFASLDTRAIYPPPNFSMSFFFCCISAFLLLVIAFMGLVLMKIWPEPDDDDSDDEWLAEDNYEFAMLDKRGCPPGAQAGYVGGPQAGYVGGGGAPMGGGPQQAGPPARAPSPIDASLGVRADQHIPSQGSAALQRGNISDAARQSTE